MSEMTETLPGDSQEENLRGASPAAWQRIIENPEEFRPPLIAQVEAWAHAERSPELRRRLAGFQRDSMTRGLEHSRSQHPELDEKTARAVVSLTDILADDIIVQWLIDPESIPSSTDIASGLCALGGLFDEPPR